MVSQGSALSAERRIGADDATEQPSAALRRIGIAQSAAFEANSVGFLSRRSALRSGRIKPDHLRAGRCNRVSRTEAMLRFLFVSSSAGGRLMRIDRGGGGGVSDEILDGFED